MGSVVVSLDCEGLWGMADHIGALERTITRESLTWAYRSLLDVLDRHDLSATFAFVSLFVSPREVQLSELSRLADSRDHRRWTSKALHDLTVGRSSGWEFCESLDWVFLSGRHEVASHSFSHIPLAESDQPQTTLEIELSGVARWAQETGIVPRTYVFPRNQVVPLPASSAIPIEGFRDRAATGGRLARTLSQLSPTARAQSHPDTSPTEVAKIPGGELLNWRCGPKRFIPASLTRLRWRAILEDAAEHDRCALLWLHPHNLITGHRQLELLNSVLADTAQLVRQGRLRNETQLQYVRRLRTHP